MYLALSSLVNVEIKLLRKAYTKYRTKGDPRCFESQNNHMASHIKTMTIYICENNVETCSYNQQLPLRRVII